MTSQSVERLEDAEIHLPDFISGKSYRHRNGETVKFKDDYWLIVPERGRRVTLNFHNLPDWLKRPAKLAAAHLWLAEGRSASLLQSHLASLRNFAKFVGNTVILTLAELNEGQVTSVQNRLAAELQRYAKAIEDASTPSGEPPTFRTLKAICRKSELHGPKSASNMVSAFNLAATMSEEVDGIAVPHRLQIPRDSNDSDLPRPVGSADPRKVLRIDQIADLELALGRDLRSYEKARAIIQRSLHDFNCTSLKGRRPDPIFDLEHYMGLNGHRQHTAAEVAALRGALLLAR